MDRTLSSKNTFKANDFFQRKKRYKLIGFCENRTKLRALNKKMVANASLIYAINALLFLCYFVFGEERYLALLKYLGYISVMRNQYFWIDLE
jgi:hypothetical protein